MQMYIHQTHILLVGKLLNDVGNEMTLMEAIAKFKERFENNPKLQEMKERLVAMRAEAEAEAEAEVEAQVEE